MGVGQKAKFIGHGIGLEINEAPVLAPRMKQELEPGMVFALEPKIVLPGVGPLGIENSWVVTADGVEKLTLCKEEIIDDLFRCTPRQRVDHHAADSEVHRGACGGGSESGAALRCGSPEHCPGGDHLYRADG